MEKAILGLLAFTVIGSVAYAVSMDMETYYAVSIGDVEVTKSEDDTTTSTRVEFSGPGLKAFMALLPKTSDQDGPVEDTRILTITNAGAEGVEDDNMTSIYIECNSVKSPSAVKCNITIISGVIPG